MHPKEYCRPDLTLIQYRLQDVLQGSPEQLSTEIGSGDWGGLEPDPGDELID